MSQSTLVVAQATTTEAPATGEAPAEGVAKATTEGTEAEGGHGGFPPMDAHSFPSQIFWLVIFFGLLYLLMSKVALPRMEQVLGNRRKAIEADLSRASALKNETEAAVQSYEKALADARANAQAIAAETKARMGAEMDAERGSLEKSLGAKLAEAESRIAASKAQSMKDVHEVAADSAAEIVSALTGTQVSKADAVKAITGLKA
ncbi:F0F1 ATP synthase subunit B' [Aestuariivirga sp.]|uniref:F0F1 ATP synthase subunit B family protein n=1 Tax=Aestuariivirga sp. TaxID=2650926 RepID=UPI003BAB620B